MKMDEMDMKMKFQTYNHYYKIYYLIKKRNEK